MDKLFLRTVSGLSLFCFLFSLYSTYKVSEYFNQGFSANLLGTNLSFAIYFSLLFVFALLRNKTLTYVVFFAGLIWPAMFDAMWIAKWAVYHVVNKFFGYGIDFLSVFSGLASIAYLFVTVLLLLMLAFDLERRFKR